MASTALARLFRNGFRAVESSARKPKPKMKQETILERKEERRLANVNTWAIDHTNEKIPPYFDGPKARAVGYYFERAVNTHPLTVPIDPVLRREITRSSTQNAHYLYYQFRNNELMRAQFEKSKFDCNLNKEIESIPTRLLNEIKLKEQDVDSIPSFLNEEIMYFEQLQQILPTDEFERRMLSIRLLKSYEGQGSDMSAFGGEDGSEDQSDGDQ